VIGGLAAARDSPLFSTDKLAELIERYPREHYSLVQTGAKESRPLARRRDWQSQRPSGNGRDRRRRSLAQSA
jgi:hypothetical protein